jgi:sugar phosphate isomerase/epimerase
VPDPVISFHATLTGDPSARWQDALDIARRAGFPAIDIVLPEVAIEPAETISEQLKSAGLAPGPASLPVEFRRDEDTYQADLARLDHLARFAAAIGVKTMFRSIPASSDLPAPELGRLLRRRISTCAHILGQHGIDLAIETVGPLHRRREGLHEFIWELPDAAEFATACDGDIGLLIDSWHWHHAQGTVEQIIELGTLVRHVHVADAPDAPADLIRDDRRLLPGRGVVDHCGFAHALRHIGYSRFVSPEVRGYQCESSPEACARRALAAVTEALASNTAP